MFFVQKIDTNNFTKNKVGGKNSTITITTITIFCISVVFAIFAIQNILSLQDLSPKTAPGDFANVFGSVNFFWGKEGVGWQDVKNSTGRG